MKKSILLTLCFIIFGIFGYAQNLKFNQMEWNEEGERIFIQEIQAESTYYVNTKDITEFLEFEVDVVNLLTSDQTVFLLMEAAEGYTQGIDISGCWGECLAPWNFQFEPMVIAKDAFETFKIDYLGNEIPNGQALITCTFRSEGYNDFTFYVQFTDNVSINEPIILKNNAYPNPASTTLNISYKLDKNYTRSQIILYNILGQAVTTQIIFGNEGTAKINTIDFAEGIYFYTIQVDSKAVETKKVIITH